MQPEQPDTEELIAAARAGDEGAMDELMRRHLPSLRAFVRANLPEPLRRRESESDLVQTACRAAIHDLAQFSWRGDGSFRAWLSQIALNKIRGKQDYHLAGKRDARRDARESAASNESLANLYRTIATPSQHAMANELVEQMESAFEELPELYRETFLMLHVLGMDISEVATEQDRTENAVRGTATRALARLATLIQRRR